MVSAGVNAFPPTVPASGVAGPGAGLELELLPHASVIADTTTRTGQAFRMVKSPRLAR